MNQPSGSVLELGFVAQVSITGGGMHAAQTVNALGSATRGPQLINQNITTQDVANFVTLIAVMEQWGGTPPTPPTLACGSDTGITS